MHLKKQGNARIYIRHCGERTVPVLQWYFRDYPLELVDGVGRTFAAVLLEFYERVRDQKEPFALAVDGDLVPIITPERLLAEMLAPFETDPALVMVNGTRVDRFFPFHRPKDGGVKAYRKAFIGAYIAHFDITKAKPESHVNRLCGGVRQLRQEQPQCAHEYGQFLWHLYEKAFQRGAKSRRRERLRPGDAPEARLYRMGYEQGRAAAEAYEAAPYDPARLPGGFTELEPVSDAGAEYVQLAEQARQDVRADRKSPAVRAALEFGERAAAAMYRVSRRFRGD